MRDSVSGTLVSASSSSRAPPFSSSEYPPLMSSLHKSLIFLHKYASPSLSLSRFPLLAFRANVVFFLRGGVISVRACVCLIRLVEHAGLMCVVSVFNQRAACCRFDVDGELIKQYLWRLHQPRHFVLPLLSPHKTDSCSLCAGTQVSLYYLIWMGDWVFP